MPVLGICYGMQTMAAQLGGAVETGQGARVRLRRGARARALEAARRHRRTARNAEGHGLLDVWMSHGDKVTALPPGFKLMASNDACADRGDGRRGARASTRCSSIPRSRTRSRARRSSPASCTTSAAARGDWNMPDYVDEAVARDPRAGRQPRK